jgi:hypothetical protein
MTLHPGLTNLIIGWLLISFPLICSLLVAAATAEPIQIDKFRLGRRSSQERRLLLATALFLLVFSSFLFFSFIHISSQLNLRIFVRNLSRQRLTLRNHRLVLRLGRQSLRRRIIFQTISPYSTYKKLRK